jgi:ribosomal protein L40E
MGWRAISGRRSAFAGLFIVSLAVQIYFDSLALLIAPFLSSGVAPVRIVALALAYLIALISMGFGPLLLLIAFRVYRGFNELPYVTTPTVASKFCIVCGAQLPLGARFCAECGSNQQKPFP